MSRRPPDDPLACPRLTALSLSRHEADRVGLLGFAAMSLDPSLDVHELESQMTAEAVVGDRVVVAPGRSAVDERLRHPKKLGDLIDIQVPALGKQLELLGRAGNC